VPEPRSFRTGEAPEDRLREIRGLLERAFGAGFTADDWEHAINGTHVVCDIDGVVVAHAAVVTRVIEVAGRRFRAGYVEAVATEPARQGQGFGSAVMEEAGSVIRRDFELGALATGRHHFYGRLGWERWQGPTAMRRDGRVFRTTDDDDAVMVLRFGPSAAVDLRAPISCEARRGDHW
jgi:aminoglycoside 2'-N-acetyltransferase I